MSKCETKFSLFPENFALSDDGFSGICGESSQTLVRY